MSNTGGFVLLYPKCPTGKHVGSVIATDMKRSSITLIWPLQYACGCVDPRKGT